MYFTVNVITQPVNTTGCMGETAAFTCVLDLQNVSMDMRENYVLEWHKTRIDDNFPAKNVSIPQHSSRFTVINTISNNTLTSVLNINNVTLTSVGPYWLKWNNEDISNMAFLSITSNGKYVYIM